MPSCPLFADEATLSVERTFFAESAEMVVRVSAGKIFSHAGNLPFIFGSVAVTVVSLSGRVETMMRPPPSAILTGSSRVIALSVGIAFLAMRILPVPVM